jgi:hypothetical protein
MQALLKLSLWRINFLLRIYDKLKGSPVEKIVRARIRLEIKIYNRLTNKADQLEPLIPRCSALGVLYQWRSGRKEDEK